MRSTRWSIFLASVASLALVTGACSKSNGNPATYVVSGNISGAAAVSVALSGSATSSTTTDASGNYSFSGLANGSYTVRPTKNGYTLTPTSIAVTVNGANVGGQNFTAAPVTHTLSGTVSGPWVEAVTITLSGTASGTTQTDSTGHYSFTGLANGTYDVTPSLVGYTYDPPAPTVTVSGNQVQDFSATSSVQSYSISGTVSYGGSLAGRVYVFARPATCGGCPAAAGTSIPGTGNYTIRGLSPGDYFVEAGMDALGHVRANANDPGGSAVGSVTITSADVAGADITLSDPTPAPTVTFPANFKALPGDRLVVLVWDQAVDAVNYPDGGEAATSYDISWGTDASATNGGVISVDARGDGNFFHDGLTNSTTLYYKIRSRVWTAASVWSAPISATVGAIGGGYTISGQVAFTVTTAGPLYVGVEDKTHGQLRLSRYANPTSPLSYSVTGVVAGTGQHILVLLDRNNDHVIGEGDLTREVAIDVAGNMTGQNVSLANDNAVARTTSEHTSTVSSTDYYSINNEVDDASKRPTAVTLFSGRLPVPVDVALGQQGGYHSLWSNLGTSAPMAGDTYKYKVLYSDGTSEILISSVTGVLDCFAQSLSVDATTPAVPVFSWAAPTSPPAIYGYRVSVYGNGASWWYPDNAPLPSTTTSATYNQDFRASPTSLGAGTYTWSVAVEDANGNRARKEATYIVP